MPTTVHDGLRRLLTCLSQDMLLGWWQTRRRLPGGKMIQLLERSDDFPIEAKIAAAKDLNGALESEWPRFPIAERIPVF